LEQCHQIASGAITAPPKPAIAASWAWLSDNGKQRGLAPWSISGPVMRYRKSTAGRVLNVDPIVAQVGGA
jgi:hypothetical protein